MMNSILKKVKNQKGFTLVELMIVIAILGILAAIAVPRFSSATTGAETAKIQADLRTIDSAYAVYRANGKAALADDAALTDLVPNFLAAAPTPPSGYEGSYTFKGERAAYKVGSTYQYSTDTSFTKK